MNLTHEVLEGQISRIDKAAAEPPPLLEAQLVEVADSMTYVAHDTDDAVKLGLVTIDELAEIRLIRETIARVHERFGGLRGELLRKAVVHELIDQQVNDVLQAAGAALALRRWESVAEARRSDYRLGPSPALAEKKRQLEAFLYERVYRHPQLIAVRRQGQARLRTMFAGYCRRPALLPPEFRQRAEAVGIARSVGDYLAGMTDRFCEKQYFAHFAAPTSGRVSLPGEQPGLVMMPGMAWHCRSRVHQNAGAARQTIPRSGERGHVAVPRSLGLCPENRTIPRSGERGYRPVNDPGWVRDPREGPDRP